MIRFDPDEAVVRLWNERLRLEWKAASLHRSNRYILGMFQAFKLEKNSIQLCLDFGNKNAFMPERGIHGDLKNANAANSNVSSFFWEFSRSYSVLALVYNWVVQKCIFVPMVMRTSTN